MIRFSLHCDNAHDFEAWFGSNADFDRQKEMGLVTCPYCDSAQVEKALMAPSVQTSRRKRPVVIDAVPDGHANEPQPSAPPSGAMPPAPPNGAMPVAFGAEAEGLARMQALVREIRARSENVGSRFAAEARDIHDGLKPDRPIIGEATAEEVRRLLEDDIPVAPLPLLPEDKN